MALGSITDELLSAAGIKNIPDNVRRLIEKEVEGRVLGQYKAQIKKLEPVLYKQGQAVGSKIAAGIMGAIVVDPRTIAQAAKEKQAPQWLTEIVMPAVTPFVEGVKSTAMPTLKGVAIGIGLALVGAGAAGGYYIGQRKAKKSLPA
jgi:hypothetical protein